MKKKIIFLPIILISLIIPIFLIQAETNSVADNYNISEIQNTINQVRSSVERAENQWISVVETKKMLDLAEQAFDEGNYSSAKELASGAKLVYALEVKGEVGGKFYLKLIGIPLIILVVIVLIIFLAIRVGRKKDSGKAKK